MKKRLLAAFLALATVISVAGCGKTDSSSSSSSSVSSSAAASSSQTAEAAPQKVTLYPYNAGLQSGPASGWVDEFFQKNGIILEVIPYSDEKTQAMLASGDLPDVVIFNSETNAKAALEAGMLLSLEDHLDKLPSIAKDELFSPALKYSREYYSNDTKNLYLVPWGVGGNTNAVSPDSERYAIKFKYDVYEQIGAPKFEKLEEVIPILKKMKEVYPKNAEGTTTWGMNLFSDFDTNFFYNMISVFSVLGYSTDYLKYGIEYSAVANEGYSIFRDDSVYKRGAKFIYEMNKAGLLDPDSLTQVRTTANKKMDTAAVVAGWAAAPAWESKGYYPVSFGEFQPCLTYSNPFGKIGVAVSAKAENVDASLKLVDMLADPEALISLYNGPQGDRWDIADNKLVFTDKFKQYRANGGGTYTLNNGEEFALYNFVTYIRGTGNLIEKYNEPFPMTLWKQYLEEQYSSDTAKAWSARYGYKYLKEQLQAEDRLKGVMDPSFPAFLTPDSDDLKLSLAALKDVIVPGTWELVYAKDEAEFEKIWGTMKGKCENLGIQSVVDNKLNDISKAKETAKQFK